MKILFTVLFCSTSVFAAEKMGDESWVLDHSVLTYKIEHPLKTAHGTSKEAKGKGKCEKGKCQFLIAVPVRSFDSGDSNRDLHMLEVTRGAVNPMVVVRSNFDQRLLDEKNINLDFDIEFAGKKATYAKVPFSVISHDAKSMNLKGTIVFKQTDFSIVPASLLTMTLKDEIPVEVDATFAK